MNKNATAKPEPGATVGSGRPKIFIVNDIRKSNFTVDVHDKTLPLSESVGDSQISYSASPPVLILVGLVSRTPDNSTQVFSAPNVPA